MKNCKWLIFLLLLSSSKADISIVDPEVWGPAFGSGINSEKKGALIRFYIKNDSKESISVPTGDLESVNFRRDGILNLVIFFPPDEKLYGSRVVRSAGDIKPVSLNPGELTVIEYSLPMDIIGDKKLSVDLIFRVSEKAALPYHLNTIDITKRVDKISIKY